MLQRFAAEGVPVLAIAPNYQTRGMTFAPFDPHPAPAGARWRAAVAACARRYCAECSGADAQAPRNGARAARMRARERVTNARCLIASPYRARPRVIGVGGQPTDAPQGRDRHVAGGRSRARPCRRDRRARSEPPRRPNGGTGRRRGPPPPTPSSRRRECLRGDACSWRCRRSRVRAAGERERRRVYRARRRVEHQREAEGRALTDGSSGRSCRRSRARDAAITSRPGAASSAGRWRAPAWAFEDRGVFVRRDADAGVADAALQRTRFASVASRRISTSPVSVNLRRSYRVGDLAQPAGSPTTRRGGRRERQRARAAAVGVDASVETPSARRRA